MLKKGLGEEHTPRALRHAESGVTVREISREHVSSDPLSTSGRRSTPVWT